MRVATAVLLLLLATPIVAAVPLDAAVEAAERNGFTGVVALGDAKSLRYERAVGFADRERRRPHRLDERWPWASVSKQATAVLVMQEVERKRLTLDTTVRSVLKDFPRGDVTIRQLLQHTAGLANPADTATGADGVPAFYRERGAKIGDAARARGYCASGPTGATAGTFRYNNCDYLVLGAVLERLNNDRYANLVRTRIAEPSGARTLRVARDGEAPAAADPLGYEDATKRSPPINVATLGAAGALIGTTRDVLAFDRALMNRRLLSSASMEVLWRGDPELGDQALGVWAFVARLPGCGEPVRVVERYGDVAGTQVRNVIAPDLGLALVVFTNDASVDFGEIRRGKGLSYDLLGAAFCAK